MKKEPALLVSGSPGLSTIPLRALIFSTPERTSPTPARSPMFTSSSAASSAYFTGIDSASLVRRNVTASTAYRAGCCLKKLVR